MLFLFIFIYYLFKAGVIDFLIYNKCQFIIFIYLNNRGGFTVEPL